MLALGHLSFLLDLVYDFLVIIGRLFLLFVEYFFDGRRIKYLLGNENKEVWNKAY
jgi:hypothetical protein